MVNRITHDLGNFVCVGLCKCAVGCAATLCDPYLGGIQKRVVDVDCDYLPGDTHQWQSKPAIATTQVNNIHARRYSNISKNLGRIGPQRLH